MAFKNVIEQEVSVIDGPPVVIKQDIVNGLDQSLSYWLDNNNGSNLQFVQTWSTGIPFFQSMYGTYYVYETIYKMHIVNNSQTQELTLVGYPTAQPVDLAHPIIYGATTGEVDIRELPGAVVVKVPPYNSGNNSADITLRLKTKNILGNEVTYDDSWWGAFMPLGNPTNKAYVSWVLYLTGAYNSDISGHTYSYIYKEVVVYKTRLFARSDPKTPGITRSADPANPAEADL